jgi:hypothetical protein
MKRSAQLFAIVRAAGDRYELVPLQRSARDPGADPQRLSVELIA